MIDFNWTEQLFRERPTSKALGPIGILSRDSTFPRPAHRRPGILSRRWHLQTFRSNQPDRLNAGGSSSNKIRFDYGLTLHSPPWQPLAVLRATVLGQRSQLHPLILLYRSTRGYLVASPFFLFSRFSTSSGVNCMSGAPSIFAVPLAFAGGRKRIEFTST